MRRVGSPSVCPEESSGTKVGERRDQGWAEPGQGCDVGLRVLHVQGRTRPERKPAHVLAWSHSRSRWPQPPFPPFAPPPVPRSSRLCAPSGAQNVPETMASQLFSDGLFCFTPANSRWVRSP
eukprot:359433-Chlamydomonas_euryale.AAC.7